MVTICVYIGPRTRFPWQRYVVFLLVGQICAYMYMYMPLYSHAYGYIHEHINVHIHKCIYLHASIYIYVCVKVCFLCRANVCKTIEIRTVLRTHTHTHTNKYTHTNTHTHTHTHTLSKKYTKSFMFRSKWNRGIPRVCWVGAGAQNHTRSYGFPHV